MRNRYFLQSLRSSKSYSDYEYHCLARDVITELQVQIAKQVLKFQKKSHLCFVMTKIQVLLYLKYLFKLYVGPIISQGRKFDEHSLSSGID